MKKGRCDLPWFMQQRDAFDDEERNTGIRAFGCPVLSYEKRPLGAVVVAGTTKQITWKNRSEIGRR
jgi:DNA-binding IclR family transcriptional regulator